MLIEENEYYPKVPKAIILCWRRLFRYLLINTHTHTHTHGCIYVNIYVMFILSWDSHVTYSSTVLLWLRDE